MSVDERSHGSLQFLDRDTPSISTQSSRRRIFGSYHNIAYPGVRATRRLISSRFVWRGLSNDIRAWTRSCLACQKGKISRHTKTHVLPIPVPARRFSQIHVDLVGPLPCSSGFTHLFTIIDRTTRWPEAVPLSTTSSSDYAQALFSILYQWFWCSGHDNIRQRTSINILPTEFPLHLTGHHACIDYSLPSPSQRIGRAFSPSTKKLAPLPP